MSEAVAPICPTCDGLLPHNDLACVRYLADRLRVVEHQLKELAFGLVGTEGARDSAWKRVRELERELAEVTRERDFLHAETTLRGKELGEIKRQPQLDRATMRQLLAELQARDELRARAEVGCYLEYCTVGEN